MRDNSKHLEWKSTDDFLYYNGDISPSHDTYKNIPQSELEFETEMCFCCGHNKGEELFNKKDDDYDDMINYQLEPSDELIKWQLEHNND